jgi:hypothetical protein
MKTIFKTLLFSATLVILISGCKDQNVPEGSQISGKVTDRSSCKNFMSGNLKFTVADSFSCVNYLYNTATHKVIMNHINAGFNCGSESNTCEVSSVNDTIIIREIEHGPIANCLCLFDLEIELQGFNQQKYLVRFIEPYAEGQEQLIFEMDLTNVHEGEYCVTRKGYPWGE